MDKKNIKEKLKKYLFFVSIVFLGLSSSHLIYSYIYFDSKEVAQKGGTITESFVGNFPSLNPLKHNIKYNSYINHILYRSLLSYDSINKKIVGDLANCDISNLSSVECFLTENIRWSNGENITSSDIISTYNIIKETGVNPVLKESLENVEIVAKESSIIFKSNIKDVNILNILFQPILAKSVIEELEIEKIEGNFSPINGIYSGKYVISKVDQDETLGFTKIFLEKNNLYNKNPVYVDNIILKFYKDYPALLQQKDNINIFNDKKQLIGDSIPKLENYKYILPQYVSVFINKDRLEYPNIRNYILGNINSEEILKNIGEENNKLIKSPFLNNLEINTLKNSSTIKTMLNSIGFYKKDYYLKNFTNTKKVYSNEVNIKKTPSETGSIVKDNSNINITEIENSITKENYNSKSKIITEPSWVDRYNFITNPEISLKGKVDSLVSEVYINDYKLNNYKAGDEIFSYKLSKSIGNIKEGQNNYKISFVVNGEKREKETITLFLDKDKQNLEKKEIDLIASLINKKIEEVKQKEEQRKILEKINIEKAKKEVEKPLSGEDIEKQNLIKALDNKFYYDKNFNPYTLNLSYKEGNKQILLLAQEIKRQIENSGIKINIVPLKLTELTKAIKDGEEKYDIFLTGINLGYFDSNLSKYFYSGQISKGINFSKIQNSELDNVLEDLKSSMFIGNKTEIDNKIKLQKSVIDILSKEAVFKPLYSPYYSNLVVKSIKGYELSELITDDIYRFEPLSKSYILKEKKVDIDSKNVSGFIKYIFNSLF